MEKVLKEKLFATLPNETSLELLPEIQQELTSLNASIIVLDDYPTGTQTVYDVPVLTTWDTVDIQAELSHKTPLFYVLTNSRSLPAQQAIQLAQEIGANISQAAKATARNILIISRGDSTLRGHYPEEVFALEGPLGLEGAVHVLVPAFWEGGRYTINDVHYVEEKDHLIPASHTPFARDAAFGYKNADLKCWIEEKTAGKIKSDEVVSISLTDIRDAGWPIVLDKLLNCQANGVCVVNATNRQDLDIVVLTLLKALQKGKKLLLRTAASIVPALAGLVQKPLLDHEQLGTKGKGGLTVIGSYVPKSSAQLKYLEDHLPLDYLEVQVSHLLGDLREQEVSNITQRANQLLKENRHVVIYTSRQLVAGSNDVTSLNIGQKVSESLVEIVKRINTPPAYILAKGGITSNDIATEALGIKRAWVKGQVLAGVPVWELGAESNYQGIPYIVFPGNVGGEDALYQVIQKLTSYE
ncbi:hypothetical protein FNH22_06785 [Fulvivirga sp. M361]|uniref:four-carbon acid sugar kinase family protein n=1 Tax=Fulvivirga sp. M361 TaxID=2594266 RepID=UPI00117AE0D9|nr:four-carbon acid sugar kinase family protein [Fulvivirga sp. M361]TRX60744.1 hypothetical protein FNH22_06785 [Fulvivirga sp. M361]